MTHSSAAGSDHFSPWNGYLWEEEGKRKTQIKSSDPAAQKRSELGDLLLAGTACH